MVSQEKRSNGKAKIRIAMAKLSPERQSMEKSPGNPEALFLCNIPN